MSFIDTIGGWVDKGSDILSDVGEAADSISDLGAELGLWDQEEAKKLLGDINQGVKDVGNVVQKKRMNAFFDQYGLPIAIGIIGLVIFSTIVRK